MEEILIKEFNSNNINYIHYNGNNLLMMAIEERRDDLANQLIDKGINIHKINNEGDNSLILAIKYQFNDIVYRLIDLGIDIHHISKRTGAYRYYSECNVLKYAIMFGDDNLVYKLIDLGADIHYVDNFNYDSTLMCSVRYNRVDIAYRLIDMGIDVHYVNKNNDNALRLSIFYNRNIFKRLLPKYKDFFKSKRRNLSYKNLICKL